MWYIVVNRIGDNGDTQTGIIYWPVGKRLGIEYAKCSVIGPFLSHAIALAHIVQGD